MKFLKDKQTRHDFVTYAMCIVAFAIVFFMQSNHMIPRMIAGQLVPIIGLLDRPEPVKAKELIPLFDWSRIPKEDIRIDGRILDGLLEGKIE